MICEIVWYRVSKMVRRIEGRLEIGVNEALGRPGGGVALGVENGLKASIIDRPWRKLRVQQGLVVSLGV